MLYYLFEYLDKNFDLPGTGVFQYITFRSAAAVLLSLLLSMVFGERIINFIRRKQIGETIRELGLEGQNQKAGTPTMGGLIIIFVSLVLVWLFTNLINIYVIIFIVISSWMGLIGFLDDYIKVFRKNKEGLKGRVKVVGQIGLGLLVGCVMYFNDSITIRTDTTKGNVVIENLDGVPTKMLEEKSTATTIPFFKNNEFDYAELISWAGDDYKDYAWLIFIPIVILIVTAVSNGANLTDG